MSKKAPSPAQVAARKKFATILKNKKVKKTK